MQQVDQITRRVRWSCASVSVTTYDLTDCRLNMDAVADLEDLGNWGGNGDLAAVPPAWMQGAEPPLGVWGRPQKLEY